MRIYSCITRISIVILVIDAFYSGGGSNSSFLLEARVPHGALSRAEIITLRPANRRGDIYSRLLHYYVLICGMGLELDYNIRSCFYSDTVLLLS